MPDIPLTIVEPGGKQADEEVVLVRAVQTCIVCPSQWDAWDDQGRYYYLRHRNGRGSVDHFADPDPDTWGMDEPFGQVARFHGQELDYGEDELTELRNFCELAGIRLADNFQFTEYEKYIAGVARG